MMPGLVITFEPMSVMQSPDEPPCYTQVVIALIPEIFFGSEPGMTEGN